MAVIHVPGEAHRAGPILAGRSSSVTGLAPDTRGWMARVVDSFAGPCPSCHVAPTPIVRFDWIGNAVACQCGAMLPITVSLPATRPETRAEKNASTLRRVEFGKLTKDLVARMKRGRA